jgi:REP element-mobilizing transposase RayT
MPHALSEVYVHITFSTQDRYPFIDSAIEAELYTYLGGICKGLACNPLRVGGHRDHVHICCLLSRKMTQAKLLEEVKKESSKWMKTKGGLYEKFYWQEGYGIFSVNPSEIETVVDYIENQRKHHERRTYSEELLAFLKKYNVKYDERYLWD